jgi:hypothetical protein
VKVERRLITTSRLEIESVLTWCACAGYSAFSHGVAL